MDTNNMNQPQNYNQQQNYYPPNVEAPITVGDWMITILLTMIPCVNIILLCVWGFGSGTPKSKANWAKAQLIWVAIIIVLGVIFYATLGALIIAAFS